MSHCSFVCSSLVRHLNLFGNALVWSETLDLVQDTVGGVHYKGCRDIMKLLFDKFDHLPRQIPEDLVMPLLKGQKVSWISIIVLLWKKNLLFNLQLLAYILDRNSSLLPAYFAHDEVGLNMLLLIAVFDLLLCACRSVVTTLIKAAPLLIG